MFRISKNGKNRFFEAHAKSKNTLLNQSLIMRSLINFV